MLAKGSIFSRFINRAWVTSRHVPIDVLKELDIDRSRPIIYVVEQNNASIGIIMSDARNFCLREDGETMMYWVYDVFVGNELIIDIPQNFMIKVKNNENEKDID